MSHKILPRVPREGPDQRWYNDLEEAIHHNRLILTPSSIAANTTADQTFSVIGINRRDIIVINKPSLTAGVGIVGARASAKDTIIITFINATSGAITPPSEEYSIISIRT